MKFFQRADPTRGNDGVNRAGDGKISVASGIRGTPPIVLLLLLVDMVSLGLSLPAMPGLVCEMAGGDRGWVFWYGAASLAYGIGFLCSAGLAGSLSDRFGRRPLMLCNCAGLALGNLAGAMAPGLALFVASRAWCGFFGSNISLAQAYVADISSPEQRGPRFGLLGALQGLGFIIGPFLGGFLGKFDLRAPFVVAGFASASVWMAAYFLLAESLTHRIPGRSERGIVHPVKALRLLAALPGASALLPPVALLTLSQNIAIVSWVPYATARFGWDSRQNGLGLVVFGVAAMVSQAALFPLMLKRFSLPKICLSGLLFYTLSFLAFGLAERGWVACAVMIANIPGFVVHTGFQTLVSGLADEQSQGVTLGGLQALSNLSLVLAPVISAILLSLMSIPGAPSWQLGAPMYFCSLLAFLALLFYRHSIAGAAGAALRPANKT